MLPKGWMLFFCLLMAGVICAQGNLVVSIQIDQPVLCHNSASGAISAVVTGGTPAYSFAWSNESSGPVLTNLMPGNYSLTVTDQAGSSVISSVTLLNPLPLLPFSSLSPLQCGDSVRKVLLNVAGGTAPYAIQWTNGSTGSDISVVAGNYSYTVTDANGCTAQGTVTVPPFTALPPFLSVSFTHVSCHGYDDGSITTQVMGGNPPYTYQWNPPSTQPGISGLAPGWYFLELTDQIGCKVFTSVLIEEPPPMSAFPWSEPSSQFINNGVASVTVHGGTPPYSYQWDTGDSTQLITGLAPGNYDLTITDANNCQLITSVMVDQFTGIVSVHGYRELRTYPNPASGYLIVEDALMRTWHGAVVLDVAGRQLATLIPQLAGQGLYRIDLPYLAPGTYILRLQAAGVQRNLAFVVQ